MKNIKIEKVNSKFSGSIQGLKKSLIYAFKSMCPKCYTYKKHCITRISSKGTGKVFLVKTKSKMLL